MRRLELENRIRDEIREYPEHPGSDLPFAYVWAGKVIISRWAWFWKRIQFWRYKVIITVSGKKALWRYK